MSREIPGYYYDEDKKKYFKIEKSHTAPSSAAWSAQSVKRRKVQDESRQAARQRAHLVRRHIRRHAVQRDGLLAGLLAREAGLGRVAEQGRGRAEHADLAAGAWSRGVVAKGSVRMLLSTAPRERHANMACIYVGGDDAKTGLGVAFATLDENSLVGSYIATDGHDRVRYQRDALVSPARAPVVYPAGVRCPQMSSLTYHAGTHRVLLTSRQPDSSCGLSYFSPPLSDAADVNLPQWLLGETHPWERISMRHPQQHRWTVHSSTPAPSSSDLVCVLGTNSGLVQVRARDDSMAPLAPLQPAKGVQLPREVFAQDFQTGAHNVLLAGGRQPRLWVADLRARETEWTFTRHASAVAHLRSVSPHQVLVAGLESSMALYDLRFFGRRPNGPKPLLTFPEHRNEAHLHIGWDVSPELGIVAAAQDNGTVRLFSLRSGHRLVSPVIDEIRSDAPIKALMFQRMPRERLPSLFAGVGASLDKYSFGTVLPSDEV